jgi:hypothetical protein
MYREVEVGVGPPHPDLSRQGRGDLFPVTLTLSHKGRGDDFDGRGDGFEGTAEDREWGGDYCPITSPKRTQRVPSKRCICICLIV